MIDLGLRNITQTNKYDTDLGHKLENVVYLELLRRGGKVFIGKNNDKPLLIMGGLATAVFGRKIGKLPTKKVETKKLVDNKMKN